jgi:hypothetical protein
MTVVRWIRSRPRRIGATLAVAVARRDDDAERERGADNQPGSVARADHAPSKLAPPARFASLPAGWRQFDDDGAVLKPAGATSSTLATSWHFDQSARNGPAGDVPRGGIFIDVLLIRGGKPPHGGKGFCGGVPRSRAYPPIGRMPLRIRDASIGTVEGYDTMPEYRLERANDRDYYVDLRVAINDPQPGPALLEEAQRALDALTLPRWAKHC